MQQNKLYVGNFPYSVNENDLRDLFASYGPIEDVRLITDRETGRSKGFAFITFATQSAAESALEQNGKDMKGRALRVNVAQDKVKTGGGGGGPRNDRPRW
ncbi:MAG: RNA-binding protein [Gammaproteobacteria bacterium]|jgi:cold-inducible RNA-binding protein|nr:RNA-binding protein [Gammaproteobacteria bacterium]